jgi:hypothetical protein
MAGKQAEGAIQDFWRHIYESLQRALGHHSLTMTMCYAHLSPEHLAETRHLNPLARLTALKSGPERGVNGAGRTKARTRWLNSERLMSRITGLKQSRSNAGRRSLQTRFVRN